MCDEWYRAIAVDGVDTMLECEAYDNEIHYCIH